MAGEHGSQYDGKYEDVPWIQIPGMSDCRIMALPMFNLFDQSNLFISVWARLTNLFTRAMFQVKIFRPYFFPSVNIRARCHWWQTEANETINMLIKYADDNEMRSDSQMRWFASIHNLLFWLGVPLRDPASFTGLRALINCSAGVTPSWK